MAVQNEKSTERIQKRNLGDEWENWDGRNDQPVKEGKALFFIFAFTTILLFDFVVALFAYMISPRLASWHPIVPIAVYVIAAIIITVTILWLLQAFLTTVTGRNFFPFMRRMQCVFDLAFEGAFKIAHIFGVSRDRVGHSFVMVYNEISRAMKKASDGDCLLLLLPRCLTKEQLKSIYALRDSYPIHIHTVSGGELARQRIRELKPTAVIGVACERDLVSGIRDVGNKISLIGIPNERPDGPCQNTIIDINELIDAIEFYVGPPKKIKNSERSAS